MSVLRSNCLWSNYYRYKIKLGYIRYDIIIWTQQHKQLAPKDQGGHKFAYSQIFRPLKCDLIAPKIS